MFWKKKTERAMAPEPETVVKPAEVENTIPVEETPVEQPVVEEPVAEETYDTPTGGLNAAKLEDQVIAALSEIYDPEIPVNIYELGLIYDVDITGMNEVRIQMTLTSPHCPVAESLPAEVEAKARDVEGVIDVAIDLVWEPPWTPERMSEAARLELGFM